MADGRGHIGGLGQRNAWYWTSSGTQWLAYGLIAAGWLLTTTVVAGVTPATEPGNRDDFVSHRFRVVVGGGL
ncbi:hypothetical protein GCM10011579_078950 [Streptomyces albiflavescens]|uniref:Uncharacterized protein n=1 Tax=Streptomyces albiflavescens TaxID=1623582 RepID=A0A917YBP4_9ACTN|nr:hypothetical protein GCM10011579_078950 [Streptomyces albiflavescens]